MKLSSTLKFWQPAQGMGIQDEDIQPLVSLSKEHVTPNCPYCQERVEENSKFCTKCGGSIGEKQYNKAIVKGSID